MISVFTPTHRDLNNKFFRQAYESLKNQTFKNFEWVLIANGEVKNFPKEDWIRVIKYEPKDKGNVGELKKYACSQCKGEYLVELDNDDELTPNALEEVNKALKDNDFCYSNCAEIKFGKPYTYKKVYGWEHRDFEWNGKQIETVAFKPTPMSFSKIWYAPNHVRAWRKDFYDKIGGHKPMRELDDHDILCRTYLATNKIKHIDKVLYIYYIHGDNTWAKRAEGIQAKTLEIHDQYIYPMVENWCRNNGLPLIDLCGGHNSPKEYKSIDKKGGDITADLSKKWPFKDSSIGVFRAHDALEHLEPIHTMKEIYRCLIPGGWLLSNTPSTKGRGAWQDPTHISFWNPNSFWYYTKKDIAKYIGSPVNFRMSRVKEYQPNQHCINNDIWYVRADLIKDDGKLRIPGLKEMV